MRERISSASIIERTAISEATEMRISGRRMLGEVDIAGEANEQPNGSLPLLRDLGRRVERTRRGDKRAKAAVHAPLRTELLRTRGLQARAGGGAGRQLAKRGFGRQLATAQRESQSIAGHRIDKACRIAGEKQSRIANGLAIDRKRPERRDLRYLPGACEALTQDWIAP